MATGKTIPSGFCSDGLGDEEELQDESNMQAVIANKRIEAIFDKKFPRGFMPLEYSDYVRDQDFNSCSTPPRGEPIDGVIQVGDIPP